MPYSGGLKRNIVQCLDDFGIPLKLSHTVVNIDGRDRVKGVTLAQVDENRKPIPGTEEYIPCDTLLLSCGLIPENELSTGMGVTLNPVTGGPIVNESLETNLPGVFACGNVLHVHDLVDYVSEEAARAGEKAAAYVRRVQAGNAPGAGTDTSGAVSAEEKTIPLKGENGVRYTVPAFLRPAYMDEQQTVRFRVGAVYRNASVAVYLDEKQIMKRKRPVLAPGEMEQIVLKRSDIPEDVSRITIRVE